MSDIIAIYNPDNRNITEKQLTAMRDLTDQQIAALAKAYPNQARSNAYLVYYMSKESATEQRFPRGTWQNLHNLRRLGRTDILPYSFVWAAGPALPRPAQAKKERSIDLSEQEVASVEGLKKHDEAKEEPVQEVKTETEVETSGEVVQENSELAEAEAELQKAIDEKAHHMIVKKWQKRVDELKGKD